ncbi:MAG: right-handed parallel beta-helix repeat-containing protein [Verrucomicrobiota bacterium]|jgi:hypothetical protein|nr:right-handed parallel beta-helix repeat-containing protein [Verrucomicrobiota bacterium]
MKKETAGTFVLLLVSLLVCAAAQAAEFHVSPAGRDDAAGSPAAPFQTIGRAAQAAYPGDTVTVHAGVYREWVNPPRGGTGDGARIVYRAAPGERVELKGSEVVRDWTREAGGVWKTVLPNAFFGAYNPYADLIAGDWFSDHGRPHHTGEVFLNNVSLYEKETLEKVRDPGGPYAWYCETTATETTIWANFHDADPTRELVEISVRPTCFYPSQPGIDFLTLRGFHISEAATQWAAPTAEQIGMVATHWNKGWIIERNVISNSKCSGITLGKARNTGHNVWSQDRSIDGSLHYIEVTFRTLRDGWNRSRIGSHIVRGNEIFACEQTGICGSMGAAFSVVEDNDIHDIWTKRQFDGAEIAGIKFHAAIDTQIRGNRICRAGRGIWLDWMAQGTRVSRNLLYANTTDDLFVEVCHGPYLVDNNILGSPVSVRDWSQGGAFAHNLFAGQSLARQEKNRYTPYHLPHQTDVAGLSIILNGDDRFYNNLFLPVAPGPKQAYGLAAYGKTPYRSFADGNVYYNAAAPFPDEQSSVAQPAFDPRFKVEEADGAVSVSFAAQGLDGLRTGRVTTERLGRAKFARQAYEQPDGAPIVIDTDYHGHARAANPAPGPFERLADGAARENVWGAKP